jgi:AraC-like DNA-binding protein
MDAHNYLALRLVRLKASERWALDREGLHFVFPQRGNGKHVLGESTQRVIPGDVLVMEGNARSSLSVPNGAELVFWSFALRMDHLFPLFGGHEISHLQRVIDAFRNIKILPASTALAKHCHRLVDEVVPQFNLDHRGQLIRIAAAILTDEFKGAHNQRTGSESVEERITQVFESISAEELLSLSVGELAGKFGCSRRHLNRLFHQHFGFSVAALRMEMRLLKAISLLRDKSTKIINVAEQCGFNHLGLFNTCFKRRFSMTPGEWRKQTVNHENRSRNPVADHLACPLRSKGLCPLTEASGRLIPPVSDTSMAHKKDSARSLPPLFAMNYQNPTPSSISSAQAVH